MKIGIITYWESQDNYGQQLQCYALQRYLKDLGHNPYLIRYKETPQYSSGFKLSKLPAYISNFNAYFKYSLQLKHNRKSSEINQLKSRDFDGFRQKYLSVSDVIYSEELLMSNPPEADAYICGSDQIWGGSFMYYLPFVPQGKLRIAYAPSFGGVNPLAGKDAAKIKTYLSKFDFIGIREASGAKLLKEHGFHNAIQVVDPTLLINRQRYASLIDENQEQAKDVFLYLLGNEINCSVRKIIGFIKSKGWDYNYVGSQGRVDKYVNLQASIPQWIDGIANSKVVITNSFHCVIFALTFHKPFIFIPLGGNFARMNGRLSDLLASAKLQTQVYDGDFSTISLELDFSAFDAFKEKQKNVTDGIFDRLLTKMPR